MTSPRPRGPARRALFGGLRRTPRRPPRRTPAQRHLLGAAACTALCVVVSTLWACYVLAHLGEPGIRWPRDQLANLAIVLPTAAAGMLLHAHRPGSPLGWVMLTYATATLLPLAAAAPVWNELADPGLVGTVAVVRVLGNTVADTVFYTLLLWLPAGRLTDRRWWAYVAAVGLWTLTWDLAFLARPRAYGHPDPLAGTAVARFAGDLTTRLDEAWLPVHLTLITVACAVLLSRLLRSAPGHRLPVAGMLAAYLLYAGAERFYAYRFADAYWPAYGLLTAAGCLWSVAVAYLVIKDGGWRLDRAARQVLIALLLGTGITALFVVLAALLSAWLVPGRGAAALLLIALVLAVGAGLPKATGRVAAAVDRLYYGERAQPYQVLSTLAGRIRQVVDPERLPLTLCATIAEELRLPGVALSATTRSGTRPLASVGRLDRPGRDFPLVHHGATVGLLTVTPRAGEERLDTGDLAILRTLADQASPAVASLALQEDLRAGRERIVAAREEERRRLRRDIHDGLGPALAGLRLRVDSAAGGAVGAPPPALGELLQGVSADLGLAITEVRRITDRLGPAPLGEFGLARAIRQLAAGFTGTELAVSAELEPDPLPELPPAVEVAAYRIAAEALNNVLRHARARHARVSLRVDGTALTLLVEDDGVGLAPEPSAEGTGVGLRSMAERAAEVGGHCAVGAPPRGGGTRVRAVLPRHPVVRDRAARG
ncbi:ATP-binding protein [Kitasatospora sp. NPDC004240]